MQSSPPSNPRSQLVAIRASRGYLTWVEFWRATGLDDATAKRWLAGQAVRAAFVDRFAAALGMSPAALMVMRDQVVIAERHQRETLKVLTREGRGE